MPIRLERAAEPLSPAARTDAQDHPGRSGTDKVILADSQAKSVLSHQMSAYCDGLVRGRSFLVAGHRGAGKTTLVDHVLLAHQKLAVDARMRLKPLPVYVNGPLIFKREGRSSPSPMVSDSRAMQNSLQSAPTVTVTVGSPVLPAAGAKPDVQESIEQRALIQVAQALHQAVSKEFTDRFHELARQATKAGRAEADELCERAARFQIELTEAPPVARLAEFWRAAGARRKGVLFSHDRGPGQGLREMVALVGVSHVYKRIAGKVEESERTGRTDLRRSEAQTGLDMRWVDTAKALGALVAGGAAGGITLTQGHGAMALLVGALVALGAGLVMKVTSTSATQEDRKIDRTFLPDLSVHTLHRVMPEMFERLVDAGLAPVFVVDELDKVDRLYDQIFELLDAMKKLFAERAFTCLLTDRGFFEQLHLRGDLERFEALAAGDEKIAPRPSVYGRNYSYFSHRVFVVFMPHEMHRYLQERLTLVPSDSGPAAAYGEQLDHALVPWVLLHRSQLNALALNRLLEAWRTEGDLLTVPPDLRSDAQVLMDVTLQLAVELALAESAGSLMLANRPRLLMALFDAAYYVPRQRFELQRASGGPHHHLIDLSQENLPSFRRYLQQRMNLDEDRSFDGTPAGRRPWDRGALSDEELHWLHTVAVNVARSLLPAVERADLELRWRRSVAPLWRRAGLTAPDDALFGALLLGEHAPLSELPLPTESGREGGSLRFQWNASVFPLAAWSRSLQELAAASLLARRAICAIDVVVRRALPAPGPGRAPVLGELAERYRLLPVTPAWSSLQKALAQLKRAEKGVGSVDAVLAGSRLVTDYARMLTSADAAAVVVQALMSAALLAALRRRHLGGPPAVDAPGEAPAPEDLDLALDAVREGLRCDDVDLVTTRGRLQGFCDQLCALLGLDPRLLAYEPSAAMPADGRRPLLRHWRSPLPLRERMQAACSARIPGGLQTALLQVRSQAWAQLQAPGVVWRDDAALLPPSHASLILCRLLYIGPARWLPLHLERATCRQWTALAAAALKPRQTTTEDPDAPSRVAAAAALTRLGVAALPARLQDALLQSLGPAAPEVRSLIGRHAPAPERSAGGRLSIIVGDDAGSITDSWPLPPSGGLVLAVAHGAIDEVLPLLQPAWLQAVAPAIRWAAEPMPAARARQVERWAQQHLAVAGGAMKLDWPAAGADASTAAPGPTSEEEFWQWRAGPL